MIHRSCGSSFALTLTLSGLKALLIYCREELRTQFRKKKEKKIPIEQDRKVHIELSFCSDSTWTVASDHLEILELLFILSFSLYFRAQSSLRWWKTGWATWWRRMSRMSRPKHKSGPETTGIAGRTVTTDLISFTCTNTKRLYWEFQWCQKVLPWWTRNSETLKDPEFFDCALLAFALTSQANLMFTKLGIITTAMITLNSHGSLGMYPNILDTYCMEGHWEWRAAVQGELWMIVYIPASNFKVILDKLMLILCLP